MVAARRNSQAGSHNKVRRPSDVAFRTSSIAELEKNFAKPVNRKSTTIVKSHSQFGSAQQKANAPTSNDAHASARSSNVEKSLQDVKTKPAQDAHAKSTNAVHTKSAPDHNKANGAKQAKIDRTKSEKDDENPGIVKGHAKSTQDVHAKSTQSSRVKSTQDAHAKPTQYAHAKSTKIAKSEDRSARTSINTESKHKKDADGSENFDKTAAAKLKPENQLKDSQKSNLSGLSTKELKEKSKSVSGMITTAKEAQDTSESSAHQEEAIVSSPESGSQSKFSPSPKFTQASSSPTSQDSRGEDSDKPQSMRGALIMSPDIEELKRIGSPGESQKGSSHTVLENTESETKFYRTQHKIKSLEDSVDEPLDDETTEGVTAETTGTRGTKPNVRKRKPKKPLARKPKDGENEAKVSDGKEQFGDGATKIPDSKAKISEGKARVSDSKVRVSDGTQTDNTGSKKSKTSIAGKRKNSLNKESRSRSDSKASSVQTIGKPEDKSRRSSLSVSFSSNLRQFPVVQKQKRESVGRLEKRRSSVKVAKKVSSKDLKRRRSTKSSTGVVAKVDPNREVSNVSLSKAQGKNRKKSVKDVVATKTKSKENAKTEDAQETRVDDTTKMHVDHTQERHENDSQETRGSDSRTTRVDETYEVRVEDSQETHEGADDGNLKKSESDQEVVVQVYVPDEGQSEISCQVSEDTPQESRDKAEMTQTGNDNGRTSGRVGKIDLKPWEDPDTEVKRTTSKRAFGDNVVEKNLVNIIPRNSLDVIKGIKLAPVESKVSANRSFHSKTNLPRAPTVPKHGSRGARRNSPDAKPLKVSNFELPAVGQGGVALKSTPHSNKPQMSMHRLASKMSTNLEKVDEGSALETGRPSAPEKPGKIGVALNISSVGVRAKPTSSDPGTDIPCATKSSAEETKSADENAGKTAEKVSINISICMLALFAYGRL